MSAYLLHRETVLCETLRCEYNSVSGICYTETFYSVTLFAGKESVSANLVHRDIVLCETLCRENKCREWVPVAPGHCTL